jgi:hypothetical protein
MRPRSGLRFRTLVLAALASSILASCASGPPRRDDTPAILELRDDYLRTNPNNPFTAEIQRGEVALGMGYREVLAAWGKPDARVASADPDEERWTYILCDDNGVDWILYDFIFDNKAVVEWQFSRNVGSGFATTRDDLRGVSTRVPPTPAPSLGEGARKGGVGSMIR